MASLKGPLFQVSREVDFCIWALETDGLHIPPFDRHPLGEGPLSKLGIEHKQWHEWIQAVALEVDKEQLTLIRAEQITQEVVDHFRQ